MDPIEIRESIATGTGAKLVVSGYPRVVRNSRGKIVQVDSSTINTRVELACFPEYSFRNPTLVPGADILDEDEAAHVVEDVEHFLAALGAPGDKDKILALLHDVREKTREANASA
jgi:hypothetical protein